MGKEGRGEEEGRGRSEIEWKEGKEEGGDRILRRERRGRRRKRDKGEGGMRGGTKGEEEEVSIAHTHTHLVQHLIKVTQLSDLLHDLLPHEERCVDWSITLTMEEVHGIVDQRLLEIYSQGGK